MRQPFEQLRCAQRELRIRAQIDGARHGKQCLDGPLMYGGRHAQYAGQIDRQHRAKSVRAKSETVDGPGGYDHDGGPGQSGARIVQRHRDGTGSYQDALTEKGVPMGADSPQVLAAARLNVFDVHAVGLSGRRRGFAVQREARNITAVGSHRSCRH